MPDLILTPEQSQVFRQAMEKPIQLKDSCGKLLVEIPPEWNQEFITELKRRAASPGPWFTGEQVQSRLQALQKEWDRTGGFDEAHMREVLQQHDQIDPGRCKQEG